MVAACSVPDFEFQGNPPPINVGGDGTPIIDHCIDGLLGEELGETDFDCGGGCPPCALGQHCLDTPDCAEGLCHEGTCIAEGCMNDVQDGVETDVDCGGGGCQPCVTDQGCSVETDCESGVCDEGTCAAEACDDQVKNGKETGVDCGGDCDPCPEDEPCVVGKDCISGECNDEICGTECNDGFANCDKKNDNACEVNTRTDVDNCGFCGNACDLPHATAECSAGECRIVTDGCEAGYQDCNGLPEDGCEVDLKTNKLNCGACNKICTDINGDPSCDDGVCKIACNDGFDDCDDKIENGCEVNLNTSSKNCNECGKKCDAAGGYSAYCKDGVCGQTLCPAGKGDCNGETPDGCETTLTNDVMNCGGCGIECVAANANVECVAGKCQIASCKGTFDDCVGGYDDGCETDTDVSTSHCGGCGKGCTIANGVPKCDGGSCEVNSCSGSFRDCDGSPKNGCETNISSSTDNCGGCGLDGKDCSKEYANATSTCASFACTPPVCKTGFGDCKNGTSDGCETDTTTDEDHCGGCNKACVLGGSAHTSQNLCTSSQCNPVCTGNYASCDNNKYNGCEANRDDDEGNCGVCGTVCDATTTAHVSSNSCSSGTCAPQCLTGYADCDTSRTNGCEIDKTTNALHCGGCNNVCSVAASAHVKSNTCSGSSCQPVCDNLYDDCDTSRLNGCEKDVSADKTNCGACGVTCATKNAASGTACAAGKCDPTCDTGWADCSTPEKGCLTPLGTTSDCTKCGQVCSGTTPFCDPAGCVGFRDIVVVNSSTTAVGAWSGSTPSAAELRMDHTLANGKGNNRMMLMGITAMNNFTNPLSAIRAEYAGITMHLAFQQLDTATEAHSYAGIFYLLDSELPDDPTTTTPNQAVAWFGGNYSWGHGAAQVVELKNTMQVAPIATGGGAGPTSCSSSGSRSGTVTFSQTGSLVYGLFGARSGDVATLTGTPQNVQIWNQIVTNPAKLLSASAYAYTGTTRTLTWNVTGCENSAIALVALKRLNWQ